MNSLADKYIVVSLLMLGATLIGCGGGPGPGPEIPAPDLSEMEPMVVKVLEEARNAVVAERESPEAWGRLGAAYHAHKLRDEAEICYRRASELAPREFRWAYFLALVRADGGAGPEEVEDLFADAARLRPDYAPLHLRAGQALLAHGRFEASREAFERAIEIDATIGAAHRGLGQVLLALGEVTQAVEGLARAAKLTPRDGAVYSALARAYQAADMPEKARSAAERSKRAQHQMTIDDPLLLQHVDSMGASARHWFSRAQADLARGDMEEALRNLALVERVRPNDPDVRYLQASAHVRLGDRDRCIALLEEALEIKPDHMPALLELVRILGELGRREEALAHLVRGRELSPREPALLNALGSNLVLEADLDGAIEVYEQLAVLMPDDARVHFNIGTLRVRTNDPTRAAEDFGRAVTIDSDYAEAHYRLGIVMERLGKPDLAASHFREAVRIDPTHVAASRLTR